MEVAPQNLSDFIVAEVARQGSEENVRKIVEANIEKTIAEAVKSAMQSYGSIGQQIKKAVEQSLELEGPLDVPSYGTMIMAVLRRKMDEVLTPIVEERLAAEISEILGPGAREVNLETVIEAMKGEIDESNWHKRCTVIIEDAYPDSDSLKDYRKIYLDPDDILKQSYGSSSYYGSDRKRSAEAILTLKPDGTISNLTVEGKDAKTTVGMGPMYGWQKTLFALYATGGKLIVEHDSDDHYDKNYGDV